MGQNSFRTTCHLRNKGEAPRRALIVRAIATTLVVPCLLVLLLAMSSASAQERDVTTEERPAATEGNIDQELGESSWLDLLAQKGEYDTTTIGLRVKGTIDGLEYVKRGKSLSLTRFLPPIGNQSAENREPLTNSSAAWAAGYYCATYVVAQQIAREIGEGDDAKTHAIASVVSLPKFQFSPEYLYRQALKGQGVSRPRTVNLPSVFQAIIRGGCASLWETSTAGAASDVAAQRAASLRGRVSAMMIYAGNNAGVKNRPKDPLDIEDLKRLLWASQAPVALTMATGKDFPTGAFSGVYGARPKTSAPLKSEDLRGLQSVAVVGFDDAKKAFRIVNSWGEDWGDKGFLWVDQDYLRNYAIDIHVVEVLRAAPTADRALVVGVNNYEQLRPQLKGCINDAALMASLLWEYGFNVQLLLDRQANKNAVRLALSRWQPATVKGAGADEEQDAMVKRRLAFYFAGHGALNRQGEPVLLPVNAREDAEDNDLSDREINQLLKAAPGRSRTVILDACFSGVLSGTKGIDSGRILGTRYVRRPQIIAQEDNPPAGGQNTNAQFAGDGEGIFYVAAARGNEPAQEVEVAPDRPQGLFTYCLACELTGPAELPSWQELVTRVSATMSTKFDDQNQHPTVTLAQRSPRLFEPPIAVRNSNLVLRENVNPQVIKLALEPNLTQVKQSQRNVKITVQVNQPGYVVVLSQGSSGKWRMMYPKALPNTNPGGGVNLLEMAKRDEAEINIGKPISIGFHIDNFTGKERVKTFWFADAPPAAKLIALFYSKDGADLSESLQTLVGATPAPAIQSQSLDTVTLTERLDQLNVIAKGDEGAKESQFYTDDLSFESVPG